MKKEIQIIINAKHFWKELHHASYHFAVYRCRHSPSSHCSNRTWISNRQFSICFASGCHYLCNRLGTRKRYQQPIFPLRKRSYRFYRKRVSFISGAIFRARISRYLIWCYHRFASYLSDRYDLTNHQTKTYNLKKGVTPKLSMCVIPFLENNLLIKSINIIN